MSLCSLISMNIREYNKYCIVTNQRSKFITGLKSVSRIQICYKYCIISHLIVYYYTDFTPLRSFYSILGKKSDYSKNPYIPLASFLLLSFHILYSIVFFLALLMSRTVLPGTVCRKNSY